MSLSALSKASDARSDLFFVAYLEAVAWATQGCLNAYLEDPAVKEGALLQQRAELAPILQHLPQDLMDHRIRLRQLADDIELEASAVAAEAERMLAKHRLCVQHGCTPSPCRTCGPPSSEGWHGCSDEFAGAALLVSPRSASAAEVRYKTVAASSDQEAEPYTFEPFREVVVQSLKLDTDDTGRYPVPPAALAYVDLVVS